MANGNFIITQSRTPSADSVGTAGVSRNDLWLDRTITLSDSGNPAGATYLWEMLDRAGSADAFSPSAGMTIDPRTGLRVGYDSSTAASPTFTPNALGTYRIRCSVTYSGKTFSKILLCAITRDNEGQEMYLGARTPAFGELRGEANWSANDRGHTPDLEVLYAAIAHSAGKLIRPQTYVLPSTGTLDQKIFNVPASPSGSNRILFNPPLLVLTEQAAGAGTCAVTIGTSQGNSDVVTTWNITSATALRTLRGLDETEMGASMVATKGRILQLAAGSAIWMRFAVSGGTLSAGMVELHLFGGRL